jgi:phosphopantothenoylcysteine decarboxylase/phosphopantothenate--cysteine ligase
VENPDILAELVRSRVSRRPVLVGFAAETGDAEGTVAEHGRAKLARKGCDLLVVNDVSAGKVFGSPENAALVLGTDGSETVVAQGPKEALADRVWDLVAGLLGD